MNMTKHIVKGLQQPLATPDLQQKKPFHDSSNMLLPNEKNELADTVCNTLYVDTDKDMHTVHADVGLTATDTPQHVQDIEKMTEAALKKAYPKEHNSWRSRRDTAKKESLPWSPKFDSFSGFLSIVGPKPKPNYQLDKIIKEYGYVPDNVRWASPTENSLNKDATRYLTHNGETHPVSVWAKKSNTPKSTIFARLRRGWSESSAITGVPPPRKSWQSANNKAAYPWPEKHAEAWERNYRADMTMSPRLYYYLVKSLTILRGLNITKSEWVEFKYNPNDETDEQRLYIEAQVKEINQWTEFYKDAFQKCCKKMPSLPDVCAGNDNFLGTLQHHAQFFRNALK